MRTLYQYLMESAELTPDKLLFLDSSRRLSVLETLSLTEHLSYKFKSLGIAARDLVALRTNRSVFSILALLALRTLGAEVVLTDPRHEPKEFLADVKPAIPIKATVEQNGATGFSVKTGTGSACFDVFKLRPARIPPEPRSANEASFIIFTSGSTGSKKPVVLSEANLISNLLDSAPFGDYSKNDIALGALPIDHVFGLALLTGSIVLSHALYLTDASSPAEILSVIERERITRMNGVPSLYLAMCELAAEFDVSSLRAGFIGGSPFTKEQFNRIEDTLGMTLVPVYGMSECIGVSCADAREPRSVRSEGVGRIYPMNEGAIMLDDGSFAKPGEVGEVLVRGPMRMLGYFGELMPKNEWLKTGDMGMIGADGILRLCGRRKDIIIRNGNNISPVKIEDALHSIEGVKAVCVVGVPDPIQGEVPAALAVADKEPDELIVLLKDKLCKNELPALILITDALPMTASGKPDKPMIREVLKNCLNG